MTTTVEGIQRSWGGDADAEGHRTYTVVHRVVSDTGYDGPFCVMNTPGLPEAGDEWGFDDDYDPWAFCQENKGLTAVGAKDGERVLHWDVASTFTTKPPPKEKQRCQDFRVEDPLLEPPKVSGSFSNKTEEAVSDRFGWPILTSSHEQLRGPQNEWDIGLDTVKIEQNVITALQGYVLPSMFKNCVNAFPLWGFGPRCIKLASSPWERVFFGRCSVYYKRTLEFVIDPRGHDRDLLDEGTKVLSGHWDRVTGDYVLDLIAGELPQYYNPQHFIRFKDRNGENTRVVLNGHGVPASVRVVSQRIVQARVNPYAPLGPGGGWFTQPGGQVGRIPGPLEWPGPTVKIETAGAHQLTTGQTVHVQDVVGPTAGQVNGVWVVDVLAANTFSLRGSDGNDVQVNQGGTYWIAGGINSVADSVTPISVTSTAHGLNTGQGVFIEGTGADGVDEFQWIITRVDADHFTLDGSVGQSSIPTGAITAATTASPISITAVGHGRSTGQTVTITGVAGLTGANGSFVVTVVDVDHFTLNNSSGVGAYSAGGTWTLVGTENVVENTQPGYIHVEKYNEVDFLLLGIPTSF